MPDKEKDPKEVKEKPVKGKEGDVATQDEPGHPPPPPTNP